ncbi:hypothetical protein [Ensifer adhaerens]|uniref:hypothetical protein n=1 Tax=Ensifer adhaerens TaxID=106592 RepID=UPI001177D828|nr:hypothetical protein [Ensifer adhaerens]
MISIPRLPTTDEPLILVAHQQLGKAFGAGSGNHRQRRIHEITIIATRAIHSQLLLQFSDANHSATPVLTKQVHHRPAKTRH